jgi:PAS domain S-box-containing protein
MFSRIKQWLEPPHFPDDKEKTAQARIVNTTGLYFLLALIGGAVVLVPFFVRSKLVSWAIILVLGIVYGISRRLLFRGRLALAVMLLIAAASIMGIGVTLVSGGIASPMLFVVMGATVFIGFLLEPRIGTGFVIASALAGLGMAIWQQIGVGPPQVFFFSPIATWAMFALALLFVHAVMNLVMRNLRDALLSARQENAARLQAEAMLRQSNEFLQSVLQNSPSSIFVRDLEGRYLLVNRQYQGVIGLTSEQAVGKRPEELHGAQAAKIAEKDHQVLASGEPFQSEEVVLLGDEPHTFFVTKVPLNDAAGQPYALCTVATDITERVRGEEAMRQASRLEATATLAGGIAHTVNNLMVSVLGYADILKMDLADRGDVVAMLDSISGSAEQASTLARQMVAYARGGKYISRVVNLDDTVQGVLHAQEQSLPSGVRIAYDAGHELWNVEADPAQMSEVVLNLLTNAVEAVEGNGRITIATRNLPLGKGHAADLEPGRYVCLSVQDTGHGMSQEVQSRIFEPFFTTKFQGRGMGLAVVYGIVDNHNGHISVQSEEGQGATFEVYLPATQAEEEPTGSQGVTETYRGAPAAGMG